MDEEELEQNMSRNFVSVIDRGPIHLDFPAVAAENGEVLLVASPSKLLSYCANSGDHRRGKTECAFATLLPKFGLILS